MRIVVIAASILTVLATTSTTVRAATLTEQQARLKAAEWIREHGISPDRSKAGPATKTVFEMLSHIRDSVLVVRGTTGYCGKIRKRTWILVFDNEARSWNSGNPVLIDARTGKVLDCRS